MSSSSSGADSNSAAQNRVLEWSVALDTVGGDEELLRSVTEVMIEEAPRHLQTIRRCSAAGDAKGLQLAAHTLKGELRHYGAEQAATLAEQLELLGRNGTVAGAEPLAEKLSEAVAVVLRALVDYVRTGTMGAT